MKKHLLTGLIFAIWTFAFLFFIKPFQEIDYPDVFPTDRWFVISLGLSLIAFIVYIVAGYIQNIIINKLEKWGLLYEILFLIFLSLLLLIFTFLFYKTDYSSGGYSFIGYLKKDFIPALAIYLPMVIFLRIALQTRNYKHDKSIVIRGENKLDLLKTHVDNLVCVSNAQNYIEVFYLSGSELNSQLIRKSLKDILVEIPQLTQVHRSHLINPQHFIRWKDKNTLCLTQIDIVISKKYKDSFHSYLAGIDSSLVR